MRSRTATLFITALLVTGLVASTAEATNLPLGSWTAVANGFNGTFVVTNVSGSGILTATFLGSQVVGTYDAGSNRIQFVRVGTGSDRGSDQFYTGNLFTIPTGVPGQNYFLLVGRFYASPGTLDFGWLTVITVGP